MHNNNLSKVLQHSKLYLIVCSFLISILKNGNCSIEVEDNRCKVQTGEVLRGQPRVQWMAALRNHIAKEICHKSIFKVTIQRHRTVASKHLPPRKDESEAFSLEFLNCRWS